MAKSILAQSGIYCIRNIVNGKVYIGSAVNIRKRWTSHRNRLCGNNHHNSKLQNSWNRHSAESFAFTVLLICRKEDLLFYEQIFIDAFDASNCGYNIRSVANSNFGLKASAETKAKLSIASRGRRHSDHTKKIMSINLTGNSRPLGCQRSTETRAKMSLAKIGIKKSAAHIEQMRLNATGKKKTPETKAKLSASLTGRVVSEETRAKISAAHKGMKMSDEFREKMRIIAIARKGSRRSEETKARMKEAWKLRRLKSA